MAIGLHISSPEWYPVGLKSCLTAVRSQALAGCRVIFLLKY